MSTTYSLRQLTMYTVLAILLLIERIFCLRLLELRVPTHVPLGTRAALSCRWQLGPADVLYSVKWYKDGKEFFRYVPRELEPRRQFPLPGVNVMESDSTGSNVTLGPATTVTEGRYRCEVSGERPLFPTVSDHSDMVVVALPEHGPVISGSRPRYKVGDDVRVNCTSGRSRPAAELSWFVNGEPASASYLNGPYRELYVDSRETSSLKLEFTLTQHHFRRGGLKLKCLATIGTVYWRSNEESAQNERIKSYGNIGMRTHAAETNLVQSSSSVERTRHPWIMLSNFIFAAFFLSN